MKTRFLTLLLILFSAVAHADQPSDYLETGISWPNCASCTGACKTISSNADWDEVKASSSSYTSFCVVPGNYEGAGEIAPGRSCSPYCTISFYDASLGGDGYTEAIKQTNKAKIYSWRETGRSNWKTRGLTISDPTNSRDTMLVKVEKDSDDNLFEGWLFEGGNRNIAFVARGSDNAHFQKIVARNSSLNWIGNDTHCFYITPSDNSGLAAWENVEGFRLVLSEVYNCNGDGIQVNNPDPDGNGEIPGFKVVGNDIYNDSYFTDGAGNQTDSSGKYACGENAIDFKAAVRTDHGADNPYVAFNNFWGFRKEDEYIGGRCPNSSTYVHRTPGFAVNVQADKAIGDDANWVHFKQNWTFDSANGYYIESGRIGIVIDGDVFVDVTTSANTLPAGGETVAGIDYADNRAGALALTGADVTDATVDGSLWWLRVEGSNATTIHSSHFISAGDWHSNSGRTFGAGTDIGDNFYYATQPYDGAYATGGDFESGSASTGKGSLSRTIKQWTDPTTYTVTGIDFTGSSNTDPDAPTVTRHKSAN